MTIIEKTLTKLLLLVVGWAVYSGFVLPWVLKQPSTLLFFGAIVVTLIGAYSSLKYAYKVVMKPIIVIGEPSIQNRDIK